MITDNATRRLRGCGWTVGKISAKRSLGGYILVIRQNGSWTIRCRGDILHGRSSDIINAALTANNTVHLRMNAITEAKKQA